MDDDRGSEDEEMQVDKSHAACESGDARCNSILSFFARPSLLKCAYVVFQHAPNPGGFGGGFVGGAAQCIGRAPVMPEQR